MDVQNKLFKDFLYNNFWNLYKHSVFKIPKDFEKFKEDFSTAAKTRFGSGWAWLCKKEDGSLEVCSSANQDNTLMPGVGCGNPAILGLDVWEHAYYLHYQNRRPDYVSAFFEVINWDKVEENYNKL